MAIDRLDEECCTGCEICVNVCPEDVIYFDRDRKKAHVKYLEDCVACFACEFFCPSECIQVSKSRSLELPLPY
jgi:NAD-dependent dihydropyrimidine dehydrogenase PreA subunit